MQEAVMDVSGLFDDREGARKEAEREDDGSQPVHLIHDVSSGLLTRKVGVKGSIFQSPKYSLKKDFW